MSKTPHSSTSPTTPREVSGESRRAAWGIIGAGLISHDFVNAIYAFKQQDLNQVIAVAARNLKSAEEFAQKFDIPKAYEGYEKLAQDPEVQVVYVGSINTTHLEVVKLLLENGKNILCEKPLGMNVKEVQEMFWGRSSDL